MARQKQMVFHGGKNPKTVYRCKWCDETPEGSADFTPKSLAAHQRDACAARLMALRMDGGVRRG